MSDRDPLEAALRRLSGSAFYRGNVFRLTGLPVRASNSDIRRRRDEVKAVVRLGTTLPPSAAPSLSCGPQPEPEDVLAAFEDLRHPVVRLVHELLWVWSDSGDVLTTAHDNLLRQHCDVLTADWPGRIPAARSGAADQRWSSVLAGWAHLLAREDLWECLERRAADYADPRATSATVRDIRARLPTWILGVNAAIATHAAEDDPAGARRHVAMLRASPFPADSVDRALRSRTREPEDRISAVCAAVAERAAPDTAPRESTRLLDQTAADLRVVETLLGADDPTTRALCDEVASLVNGLCVTYYGDSTVDRRARSAAVRSQLQRARQLACADEMRELIAKNLRILDENDREIERMTENIGRSIRPPLQAGPTRADRWQAARAAEERRAEERANWEKRLEERDKRLRAGPTRAERWRAAREHEDEHEHEHAAQDVCAAERPADETSRPDRPVPVPTRDQTTSARENETQPQVPAADRGTAHRDIHDEMGPEELRVVSAIKAVAAGGQVEQAARLVRTWLWITSRPAVVEFLTTRLLSSPESLSHRADRIRKPRSVAGCGTALVGPRSGSSDSAVWTMCIVLFSVPVMPIRACRRNARGLLLTVPLSRAARWARAILPLAVLVTIVGIATGVVVGPDQGVIPALVFAVGLGILGGGVAVARVWRCRRWLTAKGAQ